jgi:hypothetical protein
MAKIGQKITIKAIEGKKEKLALLVVQVAVFYQIRMRRWAHHPQLILAS